jgi:hypothetical protein
MWALTLLPLAGSLLSGVAASPAPIPTAAPEPQWRSYNCDKYGDCGFYTDGEDTTLYLTKQPQKPPCNCDGGDCACGKSKEKTKTVTIRPDYPTYTRCPDPLTITSTLAGGAVTSTVTTTTTTATGTGGAGACVPTQPVVNQGFNGGLLTGWTGVGVNGGNVVGTTTYGVVDTVPAVNGTLGSANFGIPISTTATTFGSAGLEQNVTLCPATNYVVSFFVGTPQAATLIGANAGAGAATLVSGLTGASTNLAGLPLAAVAGCQMVLAVGTSTNTFNLYTNNTGQALTGAVTIAQNAANPFGRFDFYFNSGAGGVTLIEFTLQCPLLNSVPTSLLGSVTSVVGGLLPGALNVTSNTGNILSTLGAGPSINVYLDQVAIDYYR